MDNDPISQPGTPYHPGGEPVSTNPSPTGTPGTPLPPATGVPLSTSIHATDTGLAPNVAAGLAVLLTLITGIVFLLVEKRNQFVRFWAMQAVFFGAAWVAFSIVSSVISSVLGHILGLLALLWGLCSVLVSLGFLVVWLIMLVKAFSGKEWELPYLGKLARQQLNTPPRI